MKKTTDMEKDLSHKKESTGWTYSTQVKPLAEVVCSPYLNDSQEDKDRFIKIIDRVIEDINAE